MQIYPTSVTQFYAEAVDIDLTFVRDGNEQATELRFRQNGSETSARRIQ